MIIYFSATGNTKYCAEYISSVAGEKIISLNDLIKNDIHVIDCNNDDTLGFAIPVYDLDLAYAVAEFLERVEFQNVREKIYAYGILTCGSSCGNAGETLRKILAGKNITLNASFVIIMPDNYVPLFRQKDEAAKSEMLTKADEKLADVAKYIQERKSVYQAKITVPKIFMYLMHKFFIPSQKNVKGFSVNDKCIGCGLCEKICPMNIIALHDKRPVWTKNNCACCLGCLHRCPTHAINRGWSAKNGRYLNPNTKL